MTRGEYDLMESAPSWTSVSLLGKLRTDPQDQEAWRDFVRRYGPRILHWCRQWRLQEADAEDVTQIVLVKLAQKLSAFEYDPGQRFRGWLKTVTCHALSDYVAARRRRGETSGNDEAARVLDSLEARDDLVRQLGEEFDRELLEEALRRVQAQVPAHHWEAFRLTALENLTGAEVAARLGMKVATVFTTRSKVQKLVQEEVRRLEDQ
jgi:RNA polymerase sigma-70 factor (ECF subfamily)